MAAHLGSDKPENVPHAHGVQGILAVSGGAGVSTKKFNDGTVLNDTDSLENLLNPTGDPGPEPSLPPHVANFLGEQLQAYYAQLMNEPVPDRFVQLLAQLNGKQGGQDGE